MMYLIVNAGKMLLHNLCKSIRFGILQFDRVYAHSQTLLNGGLEDDDVKTQYSEGNFSDSDNILCYLERA